MFKKKAYSKKIHSGAAIEDAVRGFRLIGQLLGVGYRQINFFHGQKRSQIGRVGGYDNECEEPPDAANDPCGERLGIYIGALLHQCAHGEPQAVPCGELILHIVVVGVARMRVAPLVRREPRQHHHYQTHQYVGDQRVNPDLER